MKRRRKPNINDAEILLVNLINAWKAEEDKDLVAILEVAFTIVRSSRKINEDQLRFEYIFDALSTDQIAELRKGKDIKQFRKAIDKRMADEMKSF